MNQQTEVFSKYSKVTMEFKTETNLINTYNF